MHFTECVYKTETQVKYPFDIRIPFEDINANPQIHSLGGRANIVVHTSQQGDFSIEDITIPLFPKPPPKPPPQPVPLPPRR
jgi:hypothetical protein